MNGRGRRNKGKVGERQACLALEPAFGPMKRVIGQARQGNEAPDIDGPDCPFKLEVKFQRVLKVPAWWRQAEEIDDPRPPGLAFKMGGEWMLLIRAADYGR